MNDYNGFTEKTVFSDILPTAECYFHYRESDIETCGFSDILFASKLPEGQYHSALAEYHCKAI